MVQRIDASQLERSEMDALFELVRSQKKPALVDTDGNRTEIPEAIYRMLVHVLEQMKQGRSITMMPEDKAFTTQAAANFLGVSRQHLVNMLERSEEHTSELQSRGHLVCRLQLEK